MNWKHSTGFCIHTACSSCTAWNFGSSVITLRQNPVFGDMVCEGQQQEFSDCSGGAYA